MFNLNGMKLPSRVAGGCCQPPAPSGCEQQTTPLSHEAPQFVTITHPFHPWLDQQVKIIYVRRGLDPDLLVERSDGRHVFVAMSWTDYASSSEVAVPTSPPPLLDVGGLRQAVRLIDRIRAAKQTP